MCDLTRDNSSYFMYLVDLRAIVFYKSVHNHLWTTTRVLGVSRGLKQGDSLSPSLFAIVQEVLSTNLNWLVKNNKVRVMIQCLRYHSHLHLLSADDILIFVNGIRRIMELIGRYEKSLGARVNKMVAKIFLGAMLFP